MDIGQSVYVALPSIKGGRSAKGVILGSVAHDFYAVQILGNRPIVKLFYGNQAFSTKAQADKELDSANTRLKNAAIDKAVALLNKHAPHLLIGE